MTEQDSGSKPYQERPLAPEDYADLVEIVSWVNQVATRNYHDITPLGTEQVKIVPTIAEVEQKKAETALHPFFLEKVGDKTKFSGSPAESWVSPSDDVIFFSWKCIEDMRKDKKVGYLGIGMDTVDAVVGLGAKPVRVESEKQDKWQLIC